LRLQPGLVGSRSGCGFLLDFRLIDSQEARQRVNHSLEAWQREHRALRETPRIDRQGPLGPALNSAGAKARQRSHELDLTTASVRLGVLGRRKVDQRPLDGF
jgi:hypothetical protein